MNRFDDYTDVTNRLISETVACTPREWSHGVLTIDCDGHHINYKLKNEDQPGAALISDKLRTLIDELYVRMSQHGDTWTQAVFSFTLDGGAVKFSGSYQYANAASPANLTSPAQPAPVKRPWWKFGKS